MGPVSTIMHPSISRRRRRGNTAFETRTRTGQHATRRPQIFSAEIVPKLGASQPSVEAVISSEWRAPKRRMRSRTELVPCGQGDRQLSEELAGGQRPISR